MSSDLSYSSYYSDEEDSEVSESESPRPRRRSKKDRERDRRRPRQRERERERRHARKDKKRQKVSKKRGHKDVKDRDRRRRRSRTLRSRSGSRLGYGASRRAGSREREGRGRNNRSLSRSHSAPAGATLKGRSPEARQRGGASPSPGPEARENSRQQSPSPSGSGSGSGSASRSRSRGRRPDNGRVLTIAEACEAAGRGVTTGQTNVDDEVKVLGPDEERADIDPYESFDEVRAFPRELRDELRRAGFPAPSQIQAWTWPLGLKSKDVIGIAATGSGKTLAFLLPAFADMYDRALRPEREGAGLLVMSPTRELAQQTEAEATRFGRCLGFRCVAMYGGAPKGNQMSKYRGGCHTIVACPGRLNDFLESGQVRLDGILKLVLDEADRMLDMGFEPQIRKILAKVPRKRHTLFFTATWPREVRNLASEILTKPYKVMIGNRDELKGNQDITQVVRIVDSISKTREIESLLREAGLTHRDSRGKALVFCNTKRMCEQLSNTLARGGLPCTSIHGDKDQMQRDEALSGLKNGRFKVLVATDVAARGLDIKGVGLVVNFDPANNTEDYVHRIGRTARAGAKGYAVTFLTGMDGHKARGIIEVMERTEQSVSQELRQLASSSSSYGGGRHHRGGGKGGGKGGKGGGGFGFNASLMALGTSGRGRSRSRSL